MIEPASLLPWRSPLTVTEDAVDGTLTVYDAGDHWQLMMFDPSGDEREFLMHLVGLANAYPRLCAALDKALEACRAALQVHGLNQRVAESIREGPDWSDERSAAAERAWRRAVRLAREALEMAEECDRHA